MNLTCRNFILCVFCFIGIIYLSCTKYSGNNDNTGDKSSFTGVWTLYALKDSAAADWDYKVGYASRTVIGLACRNNHPYVCSDAATYNQAECTALHANIWTLGLVKETINLRQDDTLEIIIYRHDTTLNYQGSTCNNFVYKDSAFSYNWNVQEKSNWQLDATGKKLTFIYAGCGCGGYQRLPNRTGDFDVTEKTDKKLVIYSSLFKKYYYYTKP